MATPSTISVIVYLRPWPPSGMMPRRIEIGAATEWSGPVASAPGSPTDRFLALVVLRTVPPGPTCLSCGRTVGKVKRERELPRRLRRNQLEVDAELRGSLFVVFEVHDQQGFAGEIDAEPRFERGRSAS